MMIEKIKSAAQLRIHDDTSLLEDWVNTNSGTYNTEGVRQMLEKVANRFQTLPGKGTIEPLTVSEPESDTTQETPSTLPAVYRHRHRVEAPIQILLNGHIDTVFDENHPFQKADFTDQNVLKGPGVTDMKGGIIIMLAALELFESLFPTDAIGWEVLITCDEEVGSAKSKPVLIDAAKRNHLGITFESSVLDGKLVRKRMGVGYGYAIVHGQPAHVGRNFIDGKNAIVKLASWIAKIDQLNGKIPGIIINTGKIAGGGPLNVVSEFAEAEFNIRVEDSEAESKLFEALDKIHESEGAESGYRCLWNAHLNRKAKEAGPAFDNLFNAWNTAANALGEQLQWRDTGGGSDGNILQAAGLPIIDNLGMIGDKIHSSEEFGNKASITQRTVLVTTFLWMLSNGEFDQATNEPFAHQLKAQLLTQLEDQA